MSAKRELVLRITPNERSIRVEEMKDGVTSFKEIALETFYDCVRYSIRHEGVQSGFLPQNCFHVSVSENGDRDFCLWHPHLHADISYFGTEYPDFPLPRLVFRFRVSQEGKVFDCRLGVVEDILRYPTISLTKGNGKILSRYYQCHKNERMLRCLS